MLVIQGEGVIKYAEKNYAEKGGVEQMPTLADKGGRGGRGNTDIG